MNWLVLATGLLAAVPTITSMARGLAAGAAPLGDRAIEATRAIDVLTFHPPALGEFSAASNTIGHDAYSPGPALFWLLALPARIGGAGLTVWMGLVNAISVVGVVWLAHRRGGRPLMLATGIATALMTRSLTSETWHDILNSAAPLLPFTFLIFICWSLACGEHRWLPLAVLLASFVAQAHVMFALPSLVLLVVSVVGLIVARRHARTGALAAPAERSRAGPVRRWALAAVVIGLICWAPPLAQQAAHTLGASSGPGNLALEAQLAFSHGASVGYRDGWHALVRAVGFPPWWLRPPRSIAQRLLNDVAGAPSVLSSASCLLVLVGLLVSAAAAARRRRIDVAAAAIAALGLCVAVVVATAGTPTRGGGFFTLAYSLWWTSPAGMWVWLILGFSLLTLMRPLSPPRWRRFALPAQAATLGGLVCVAAVVALVAIDQAPDADRAAYRPIAQVDTALRSVHPLREPVLVQSTETNPPFVLSAVDLEAAVTYSLRRAGVAVKSDEWKLLGGAYQVDSQPIGSVVTIRDGVQAAPPGGRVVARLHWASAGLPVPRAFTVTVAPGPASGARAAG